MVEGSIDIPVPAMPDMRFGTEFSACLELSLRNMLGMGVASAAGRMLGLGARDVDPMEIFARLDRMFGGGSNCIKRIAMKDFFDKLDLPWEEWKTRDVDELLEAARSRFETNHGGS